LTDKDDNSTSACQMPGNGIGRRSFVANG